MSTDAGKSINSAAPMTGLPDIEALQKAIYTVMVEQGWPAAGLSILAREINTYISTFPSEIVTCHVADNRAFQLFLKYSADRENGAYGHRGGVAYEAQVYGQLLNRLDISTPGLHGIYCNPDTLDTWLLLDYLAQGTRMLHTTDTEAMVKATSWLGRFHALCSTRIGDPALSFLNSYSPEYYRGWVNRTLHIVREAGTVPAWLQALCERHDEVIEVLCDASPTIIHGEYYPKNILLQDGLIYPVDWESAAIGSGMIDLAMLTEGWAPDVAEELKHVYQRSRWADVPPHDLDRELQAARIYVQFRWLGDQLWLGSKRTNLSAWTGYLEALHGHAAQMGLI